MKSEGREGGKRQCEEEGVKGRGVKGGVKGKRCKRKGLAIYSVKQSIY